MRLCVLTRPRVKPRHHRRTDFTSRMRRWHTAQFRAWWLARQVSDEEWEAARW